MSNPRSAQFVPSELWRKAREPTFWLDSELRIAWVNEAWETLTGHKLESVTGLPCHAHAPARADDPAELAASFRPPPESVKGKPAGTPVLIFHAGGERIWRRVEYWPFLDANDTLIGLLGVVRNASDGHSVPDTETGRLHVELLEIRRRLVKQFGFDSLLGSGPAHGRLLEQVRLAAKSTVPVLILGEPGTGKRHVARVIHQNGPDPRGPLIPFDAEALPAGLLEAELFPSQGGEASSEPDESQRSSGRPRLPVAPGASVLFRDILLLPRDVQTRLLAALDPSVRLIGTSVLDPETALAGEQIRPDFYFALTALVVRLRPLRDRRDELAFLAQHMLERANQRGGLQKEAISPEAVTTLSGYDWPGNLLELARVIDHAHSAGRSGQTTIAPDDLPASIRGNLGGAYLPPPARSPIKPLDQLLTEVEQRAIERALAQARGKKSRAADLLGISRPRLYRRIKELNMPDQGEADDEPGESP